MKETNTFLDSNILVYAFDKSDLEKHNTSKNIINNGGFCISVQVVNEFVNVVTSKIETKISYEKVSDIIDLFPLFLTIKNLSFETSRSAIKLKNKYRYSYFDSLILASALENDCDILFSEDLQHNQIIENKLKIINPFLEN